MQKFEIKNRYTDKVIFSAECETMKDCVELAAGREANLSEANLRWANLSPAGTIQNFTTIAKIGSREATLQVFLTESGLFFSTGCQTLITEETFLQRVKDTHAGTKYERQYLAAVDFVKVLFEE